MSMKSSDKGHRNTSPCYYNTTLGNRLYAQRKGPSVTNPICWTSKNCFLVVVAVVVIMMMVEAAV